MECPVIRGCTVLQDTIKHNMLSASLLTAQLCIQTSPSRCTTGNATGQLIQLCNRISLSGYATGQLHPVVQWDSLFGCATGQFKTLLSLQTTGCSTGIRLINQPGWASVWNIHVHVIMYIHVGIIMVNIFTYILVYKLHSKGLTSNSCW